MKRIMKSKMKIKTNSDVKLPATWGALDFQHDKGKPSKKVQNAITNHIDTMLSIYDNMIKNSKHPIDDTRNWIVQHLGRLHGEIEIIKAKLNLPNW